MTSLNYKVQTLNVNYNRIWILNDIHMGIRSNSLEWLENQRNFFYNFYIPYLSSNKQSDDILLICGDFFDSRQSLDIVILNAAIDIIHDLTKIIPVYFLVGNHDITKKNETDVNSLRIFKFIENVTIFEKPTIITNNSSKILIMPWVGNKNDEENYIKENEVDYIFAHTDINGFNYDNGKPINKGVDYNVATNVKRIFSGHIHKRQENNKLVYTGSPYHTKRSDIGNQKGFYIFNTNKNEYEFIKNNYSPVFQKIKLEDLMEYNLDFVISILANNYTDIIVPDKYIHIFNLTKFIDILQDCQYKKIETTGEKLKQDDDLYELNEGEEIKDIPTLLEQSINELNIDDNDKLILHNLNKKYYGLIAVDNNF